MAEDKKHDIEYEKYNYVSRRWFKCVKSFDVFKEGEHYWFDYIGNDVYNIRSDNERDYNSHISQQELKTNFVRI